MLDHYVLITFNLDGTVAHHVDDEDLDWCAGPSSELHTGQKTDAFRSVIMLLFPQSMIVYLCFLRLCRSQREIRLQCGHA